MEQLKPFNLKWLVAVSIMLGVLSFPVMARVWFDFLNGGQDWRQGDWLINSGSGFVRRALIGDALIWLSDIIGIGLLPVVQLVQTGLFVALVFVIWLIAVGHKNPTLILLLTASPAFFLMLWAGDIQGTMRKELFILLALALLTLGGMGSRRGASAAAILAALFYTLGCIGNMLHIFMAPALLVGFYLLFEAGRISKPLFRTLVILTIIMSALWLCIAVWWPNVSDLGGMCDPLLARGFSPDICGGALRWMVAGLVDHGAELKLVATPDAIAKFAGVAVLSCVPVVLSIAAFNERRDLMILCLICFLPMLPLYAVATDWGRWISVSYTGYAFLLILANGLGRVHIVKLPPRGLLLLLLALALVISPAHGIGWQPGGAMLSIIVSVSDFL